MMASTETLGPSGFSPSYEWAQAYRQLELSVIPAMAGEKRPLSSWKEYQENGIPAATFDRWYGPNGEHRGNGQMGFITGRACLDADSALFTVDLDMKDGANGLATWLALLDEHNNGIEIETWTARTGSGGRHLHFRCSENLCPGTGKGGSSGIDIRGVGGFIMAPPSAHHRPGTFYEWENGLSPWETEIAEAPAWLIDYAHTIARAGSEKGEAPKEEIRREKDAFGLGTGQVEDGRETAMAGMVYAAFLNETRKLIRVPTLDELVQNVWPVWQRYAKTHVEGKPERGFAQVREKCRYVLARFERGDLEFKTLDDIMDGASSKESDPPGAEEDWSSAFAADSASGPQPGTASPIQATPFVLPAECEIPRREWLYGHHLIRRFVSCTVAPGGVGKSQLSIADALAMASGRTLLRDAPVGQLRVWYWNGEDPIDEIQRRIVATAKHYGISRADIAGHLFADSGRDTEIKIAFQDREGVRIAVPVADAVERTIRENEIDVLQLDPFVSSHAVSENDNMAIDAVVKTWGKIAQRTGCAIELVHHVRKTNGAEVTVEDGRGAVALLAAVRSARALNQMSPEQAKRLGVSEPRRFFSATVGKANLYVPTDASVWHQLVSVDIANGGMGLPGDSVGVVTTWSSPDPFDEVRPHHIDAVKALLRARPTMNRHNAQSTSWVGYLVCEALGWDGEDPADRHRVEQILSRWIENQVFRVSVERTGKGREVKIVEVG